MALYAGELKKKYSIPLGQVLVFFMVFCFKMIFFHIFKNL